MNTLLLRWRFSWFRRELADRLARLRQSAITWVGILYLGLPALVVLLIPAYKLVDAKAPADEAWWWMVLSALSWCLVLLQKDALQSVGVERYLNALPISHSTRVTHDLVMVVLANHLFWLICLPAMVMFMLKHGATWPLTKLIALMWLLPVMQVILIRRVQIPWLVLLLTGVASAFLLWTRQRTGREAGYLTLLCLPLVLSVLCLRPVFTAARSPQRRWRSARLRLARTDPWLSLYVLLLTRSASVQTGLRLIVAAMLAGLAHRVGMSLFAEYQVLWLMLVLFTMHYLINGLAFAFSDAHQQAQMIRGSWPLSARWWIWRDAMAVFVMQAGFAAIVIVSGWAAGYLAVEVWWFFAGFSLLYVPLLFLLATVSPKNILSYGLLSLVPGFVLILVLFVRTAPR